MTIYKPFLLILLISLLSACGFDFDGDFHSLVQQQPMVLKVDPPNQTIIKDSTQFSLHFSQRLDIEKINQESIALIRNGWEEHFVTDTKDLMEALQEEQMQTIRLRYQLQGSEKSLILIPERPLEEGIYHLTVTPHLAAVNGAPFNQSPGASPQAFVARYGVGVAEEALANPEPGEETPPQFGPTPESLVLNEILYDGKISETDGEAFVELLGSPGADISHYQIVLINGADGEPTDHIILPFGSLLDSQGLFVVADLRTNSKQTTQVANFDYLDHFDPQNGPDAVHLLDRNQKLIDSLWYGEGAVSHNPKGLPLGEGDPAPDVPAGHSLSRLNGQDSNDNGLDFEELTFPSPGEI